MAVKRVFLSEIKAGHKFISYGHIKVKLNPGNLSFVPVFNFNKKKTQELKRYARVIPYNGDVPADLNNKVMGST